MSLITDKDILDIEKKLSIVFDDGSKEFIKCDVTKDIQACPGAGKTTALVAKLDILANKMPFSDKTGILVLTHTNVAVEEIKRKLGYNSSKILGHPNHLGTFQSFVNKYLAIPMYVKYFKKKPSTIDSNIFEKKLISLLQRSGVGRWLLDRSNDYLLNIETFLDHLEIYEDKIVFEKSASTKRTLISKKSSFFTQVKPYLEKDPVLQVAANGYLSFDHCYDLAEEYLRDIPEIANIISARFKYVFVDESQDTDTRQFSLLKSIFDNSNSIVQKIGDNDQAIFNFGHLDDVTWQIDDDHIKINNTKRLSPKICIAASKFSITNHVLQSDSEVDINPVVIVFDDDKIDQVLPKFAELIKQNNLHLEKQPYFKAIGNIGKLNENPNYHTLPNYISQHVTPNPESSIDGDLREKIIQSSNEVTPHLINNVYWKLITQYLDESGVRNVNERFTRNTLYHYLRVNYKNILDELRKNSFHLVKYFFDHNSTLLPIENSLKLLSSVINFNYKKEKLISLINNYKVINNKNSSDTISFMIEDSSIDIHVSTIHRAKGETHTATLVLETFKNGYDINQLLPLLMNQRKNQFIGKKKVLYVGMTRPTHLLCLAIHKSYSKPKNKIVTLSENEFSQIKSNGYEVVVLN